MPTPEFILSLRSQIGTDLLWLPGITAVVFRDGPSGEPDAEVLMVRRSDNGAWTPIGGIVEPGEEPWRTAERESFEEASVVCVVEGLAEVTVETPGACPNGDRVQFLNHTFTCRWISGEPQPGDDECTAAAFFSLDDLPPMSRRMQRRIQAARAFDGATVLRSGLET